ncbi:NAD(P)/FAD-dependent oxidoreductase [Thermodesulfobacteriota bacterium]
MRKHVMIGAGAASLSALKHIRKVGSDDAVVLITMEDQLPYSPMSLPYLIMGKRKASEIRLADEQYLEEMNVTFVRGLRVNRIEPDQNRIVYENGESETYDTLLVATGSEPKIQPKLAAQNVPGFHIMEDFLRLEDLKEKSRVTILGAGFVGTEIGLALSEKGHRVHIIAPRERILRQYFGPELDDIVVDLFARHGIRVERNWGEVTRVNQNNGSCKATFASGENIETDLLIAATGVRPRVSLLEGSGIETNQGIVVDRKMRTNIPNIFAAGDVAETANFLTGQEGLSLIWPSAIEQGKVAGSNMAGQELEYDGWISMNVFNFFGHFAVSIGEAVPAEGDEVLLEKDETKSSYKRLVCRNDQLIGANFFNIDIDAGVIQYLVRNRVDIGPHKELLFEKPKEVGLWLMHETEKQKTLSLER